MNIPTFDNPEAPSCAEAQNLKVAEFNVNRRTAPLSLQRLNTSDRKHSQVFNLTNRANKWNILQSGSNRLPYAGINVGQPMALTRPAAPGTRPAVPVTLPARPKVDTPQKLPENIQKQIGPETEPIIQPDEPSQEMEDLTVAVPPEEQTRNLKISAFPFP